MRRSSDRRTSLGFAVQHGVASYREYPAYRGLCGA
jgi:hypothetical protein